jgi:hypothetical protein
MDFLKTVSYESIFNSSASIFETTCGYKYDKNPIDTLKRYWNDNMFWDKK